MSIEAIIAVAIAVALGVVNIVIKVNEKMNKKPGNNRYPCREHDERLKEGKVERDEFRKEFNTVCLAFTEKLTRVETLVGTIIDKIDDLSNGR
jgi:hypothetical protein